MAAPSSAQRAAATTQAQDNTSSPAAGTPAPAPQSPPTPAAAPSAPSAPSALSAPNVPPTRTARYRPAADAIIDAALSGNDAWKKMQELCDGIGHRLSGSDRLDRAVEWAVETLKCDGQENVHSQAVTVPHWVRGRESLTLNAPQQMPLSILGLGGSIGTPPEGLTADVVAVADKVELDLLGDAVAGKIVLFNHPMPPYDPKTGTGYGSTVQYRSNGAAWAAEKDAVAALVRSVTARSLNSPHTGAMRYRDEVRKIPTAAISIEHAELIARLFERGVAVNATLSMEAATLPDAPSANVIAELRGSTLPDEVVVIGGHLDSWDVGQGAQDDGGGCVISMEAVNVLRKLGLRPRRTIRVVLFTNEENGLRGGRAYAEEHADQMPGHVAAIESDGGVFAPTGFSVSVSREGDDPSLAVRQLAEIAALLGRVGATQALGDGGGADIGPMKPHGVPLLSHNVDMSTYFDYHHSPADTLDKVSPQDLSRNVAALAVTAYVLADMPGRLGREGE